MISVSNDNNKLICKLGLGFMAVIIIGFLLRDSFGVNIPTVLFLVLYTLGFLLLRPKELVLFFVFLVPLSNGPLLYYLNVIFGISFLLKNIRSIRINNATIIAFLLMFWESLHTLPSVLLGFDESIIKFLGFTLCLLVTTIVITNDRLVENYKSIIYSWTIGFGSFCTILLIKYIYNFGINNFATIVRRFGWIPASLDSSATTLLINPNALGKLVILTVFCLLTLFKYEKKHSWLHMFLVMYFMAFGLMSGSRSFLLVFALLMLIYFIEIILTMKDNTKLLIFSLIVVVVMSYFAINYMESTLNMVSKRLQSKNISGSRFDIYKQYFEAMKNSFYLIFGSGMQDYNLKYNITMSSHNFFIEVISIWGIIGLNIVIVWFISLYKSLKISKNISIKNKTILHYLPLMGLFLYAQTGQFFISYYHTLPTLIVAFINIKYMDFKISRRYINKELTSLNSKGKA